MISKPKKEIIIFLSIFIGIVFFIMWILNGGAYAKELRYRFLLFFPAAGQEIKAAKILEIENGSPLREQNTDTPLELVIPKIGVAAPIIIPSGDTMSAILAALEEGVGLYPNSASPGKGGRSIILGHSSRASWYRGGYATVFALLVKLSPGDDFVIKKGATEYRYRVFAVLTLSPEATNELVSRKVAEEEVDLITCYPIGSSSLRTVVQAKLIK